MIASPANSIPNCRPASRIEYSLQKSVKSANSKKKERVNNIHQPTQWSKTKPLYSTQIMAALRKLDSYKTLKADWNSYKASPPLSTDIEQAKTIVRSLSRRIEKGLFVAPGPDGEILLSYTKGSRSFELEVESGQITAIAIENNLIKNETSSILYAQAEEALIQWLSQ